MPNTNQKFPRVSRIQSLKNAFRLVHNPIPVIQETMLKYGDTYAFHIGGKTPAHASRDPEVIKHVLRMNHKNYQKSPFQSKELASYIGKGLLTNNGGDWLRQRRLIQPVFHRKNINKLINLMDLVCARRMHHILGNSAGSLRIHHLAMDITFHIAAKAIFGDDVTSEELRSLRDDIERVQKMIVYQIRQPYKQWYYQLSGAIRKHKKLAQNAKRLVAEKSFNRQQSPEIKEDLLQLMLQLKYEDSGSPMSVDRLTDELIILLIAGHETTAQAVSWAISLIARHPDWQRRIKEEIDQNLDPVKSMQTQSILFAVINETLRLYPPAWVIDRISIREDSINGRTIPPQSFMMCFVYGLHRHEKYWENPNEFRPERFLKQEVNSDHFIPFGAGPRLCIGHHFAMLELYVILKNILKLYNFKTINAPLPGLKPLITLQPNVQEVLKIQPSL